MLNKYTTLCDQVRQQLSVCRWFSSTNKTDRHYITEILLKVALSKITPNAGRMENLNIENLTTDIPKVADELDHIMLCIY
jgi:hypothetical protein